MSALVKPLFRNVLIKFIGTENVGVPAVCHVWPAVCRVCDA